MRISDWSSDVCSSDLTLIEAMLVGTPIVATRSGGNIEALRDGDIGQLVQPESASALAAACQRYCDSPAFAKSMADRARTDACSRFGEDAHARQIMAIYDRMLSRNPASAVEHRQLTRGGATNGRAGRSEEHTSELQSLLRTSYAV